MTITLQDLYEFLESIPDKSTKHFFKLNDEFDCLPVDETDLILDNEGDLVI